MKDEKKLIGDQAKLDANKDGEITADDFAALRERTQKQMGGMMQGQPLPTEEEQMNMAEGGLLSDDRFGEKEIPIDFREEFNKGDKADSVGSKILKVLSSPVDFIAKLGRLQFDASQDANNRLKEKISTAYDNRLDLVTKSLPVIKGNKSIDEFKKELKELYDDEMIKDDRQYRALINNYFYHFKNKHLPNFQKEIAETGKMPKDVVKYFDDYEAFRKSNKYKNPYSGKYTRPDLTLPSSRDKKQEGGPMSMDDQMKMAMSMSDEPEMKSDDEMEDSYLDFIINEALSDEEEAMLMNELQNNPQLSILFDKVMDVAIEFSGSGPVEGPGSEVSDSIPARLSDGEFVFTAKAVDVIGADNLMSMMKQAEAQADKRQPAQEGGLMEEDEYNMPVEEKPTEQVIRVTKETVGSQATMQEENDLIGDEIKKSMLSNRPYVRS